MYGVLHKNGERIIATHANQALNKTGSDLLILAGDLYGFKFVVTSQPEKYHPRVKKNRAGKKHTREQNAW
jgi:hypothetical protein